MGVFIAKLGKYGGRFKQIYIFPRNRLLQGFKYDLFASLQKNGFIQAFLQITIWIQLILLYFLTYDTCQPELFGSYGFISNRKQSQIIFDQVCIFIIQILNRNLPYYLTVNNYISRSKLKRMSKLLALVLLTILWTQNVDAATFSINSVSTCTQQTGAGSCTRWEQNGSVTETTTCFPKATQLYVLEDQIQVVREMGEVKIGDKVLSFVGNKKVYSQIVGWLHKQPESYGRYLQIVTSSSSFEVSAYHNVGMMDGSYTFAKELLNQRLHNGQIVREVRNVTSKGIYAPLTETGNFYVKMSEDEKTLVHCFANIRNPQFYEPFVFTLFNIWQYFGGMYNEEAIHPAAAWMKSTFRMLVEQ